MSLAIQQDSNETASFGAETVKLADKQARVDAVFDKVARQYDLMNDLMSAGLHRAWKDAMAVAANPPRERPFAHFDVAGGTGDIALAILKRGGPQTQTTILDINPAMLESAKNRIIASPYAGQVNFIEGNAEGLSFPDRSFDLYTIAFGIRNVPRIERALGEAFRVLKPGGRFLCLEFSHVDVPVLSEAYELYSQNVIPQLGEWIVGDGKPYRYLVDSICGFHDQKSLADLLRKAGFENVSWRNFCGGIAALHSAWRI